MQFVNYAIRSAVHAITGKHSSADICPHLPVLVAEHGHPSVAEHGRTKAHVQNKMHNYAYDLMNQKQSCNIFLTE